MSDASFTFGPPAMTVSYPASLNMHMIYDTELEMLRLAGKDRSLEISLASGGAGIGLVQNLLRSIHLVVTDKVPDPLDFMLALLCVVLVAVAVVSYINSNGIGSRIDKLISEIRLRPKKGGPQDSAAAYPQTA